MSLSTEKETAKTELKTLLSDMRTREEISDEEYANRLIDLLEKWIAKAEIKYNTGLVAGTNPVTGTFTGQLK